MACAAPRQTLFRISPYAILLYRLPFMEMTLPSALLFICEAGKIRGQASQFHIFVFYFRFTFCEVVKPDPTILPFCEVVKPDPTILHKFIFILI